MERFFEYTGEINVGFSNWVPHKPSRGESLSYGDFKEVKLDPKHVEGQFYLEKRLRDKELLRSTYLIPDLMVGSDYAGSDVEKSNYRSFLREYGKWTGVHALYGGYDTYGVAIRLDVLLRHPEVKDTLDALEN